MAESGLRRVVCLLVACLGTAGCAGWRAARQPEIAVPEAFRQPHVPGAVKGDRIWWTAFGDTTLDRLMEEALADNLTLAQALARLRQLAAARTMAQATWFPWITAQGTWTESGTVEEGKEVSGGGVVPGVGSAMVATSAPRFAVGLAASYELDLWGRLWSSRDAATADWHAGASDVDAVLLTLSAQVARTYFSLVELRLQDRLLKETVAAYEDSYALVSARYQQGLTASVDVYQAQTNLAAARAQRSQVAASLARAEHELSVLLGRYPRQEIVPAGERGVPASPDSVPPGLPSDLIQRRPDVRAAYWRLLAADRRAAEAVAQRLPTFSLTASITGSDDELSDAFDPAHMIWKTVGNLVLPVFEAGRRKANAERAEAAWEGALAAYEQAVLTAFREVEDALVAGRRQRETVTHLEAQVRAARATLRVATDRYLQGVSDYLPVMVAQSAHLNAQRGLLSAQRALADARVALVTALGGGWMSARTRALAQETAHEETLTPERSVP